MKKSAQQIKSAVVSSWTGQCKAHSKLTTGFLTIVDKSNRVILFMLCILLAAMACLGIAQVIARYLLGAPLTWSEEVLRFSLIWLPFIGAGVAVRRGLLISVEIFIHAVPNTVGRIMRIAVLVLSSVFWLTLIVYGTIVVDLVAGTRAGATELPMSFIYLAIPIGSAFAFVNTIAALIDPPKPHATEVN